VGARLSSVIGSLTDTNSGRDITAIDGFWSRVYRIGDPHTVLAGLAELCLAIGAACDRYADAVDQARSRISWALAAAGIAVGLTTAVGIVLTIVTLGGSDAGAAAADTAEAAAILAPEAAAADAAISADTADTAAAIGDDLVTAVEDATATAPEVQPTAADTTQLDQAVDEELTQPADDMPADSAASDAEKINDILSPGGQPVGEPGNTPDCRLVENQDQLDELWDELKSELGREPRSVGPGGGDDDYLQYRPWSKTGGPTIDINVQNEPIEIIHIK
jgi:hypothetical protein